MKKKTVRIDLNYVKIDDATNFKPVVTVETLDGRYEIGVWDGEGEDEEAAMDTIDEMVDALTNLRSVFEEGLKERGYYESRLRDYENSIPTVGQRNPGLCRRRFWGRW